MEICLSQLERGKEGIVKHIADSPGFRHKINSLGIRTGKNIRVISLQPFKGPLVIKVDGMKVAIGRGMADNITVEIK
jgi:ferrous iron transport protein A|tara:strand:+ start:545 stop:775 length:231 start_codon:yes stop_codon:yes gene_type:complete